jgi:hypothetical protein
MVMMLSELSSRRSSTSFNFNPMTTTKSACDKYHPRKQHHQTLPTCLTYAYSPNPKQLKKKLRTIKQHLHPHTHRRNARIPLQTPSSLDRL